MGINYDERYQALLNKYNIGNENKSISNNLEDSINKHSKYVEPANEFSNDNGLEDEPAPEVKPKIIEKRVSPKLMDAVTFNISTDIDDLFSGQDTGDIINNIINTATLELTNSLPIKNPIIKQLGGSLLAGFVSKLFKKN